MSSGHKWVNAMDPDTSCTECGMTWKTYANIVPSPCPGKPAAVSQPAYVVNGHNFGQGRHCVDCGASMSGAVMGSPCHGLAPLPSGSGQPTHQNATNAAYRELVGLPPLEPPRCECGAASTGAKAYDHSHARYCPARAPSRI